MWGNYARAMHLLYLRYFKYVCLSFCRGHHGMGFFFLPSSSFHSRKDPSVLLAFGWILGSVIGLLLAVNCDPSVIYGIRGILAGEFSVWRMIFVIISPLVISFLAISHFSIWLLIPIAFVKGMAYAFVSALVFIAWGSAGWLIRLLLIFSDTVSAPVLLYFWLSSCRSGSKDLGLRFIPAASWIILACAIDYRYVSPLLAVL